MYYDNYIKYDSPRINIKSRIRPKNDKTTRSVKISKTEDERI